MSGKDGMAAGKPTAAMAADAMGSKDRLAAVMATKPAKRPDLYGEGTLWGRLRRALGIAPRLLVAARLRGFQHQLGEQMMIINGLRRDVEALTAAIQRQAETSDMIAMCGEQLERKLGLSRQYVDHRVYRLVKVKRSSPPPGGASRSRGGGSIGGSNSRGTGRRSAT